MPNKRNVFKKSDNTNRSVNRQFRMVNLGLYSGPRQSVQQYNVAEQASDAINRAVRTSER
jgi:hypothetical protein